MLEFSQGKVEMAVIILYTLQSTFRGSSLKRSSGLSDEFYVLYLIRILFWTAEDHISAGRARLLSDCSLVLALATEATTMEFVPILHNTLLRLRFKRVYKVHTFIFYKQC